MRLIAERLRINSGGATALLLALLSFIAPVQARENGSYWTITWRNAEDERVASALNFTEVAPAFMMSRMLLEAPNRGRVVLTESLDAREGEIVHHLIHIESGWWIQVQLSLGIEETELKAFFNRMSDALEEPGARMHVRLRSSENLEWDGEVPVQQRWISTTLKALSQDLANEALGRTLQAGIPAELQPILAFMTTELRLGMMGENFRTMSEFLAPFLPKRALSPDERSKLVREDSDMRVGLTVTDPEFVELLGRFPSIDPMHPTELP